MCGQGQHTQSCSPIRLAAHARRRGKQGGEAGVEASARGVQVPSMLSEAAFARVPVARCPGGWRCTMGHQGRAGAVQLFMASDAACSRGPRGPQASTHALGRMQCARVCTHDVHHKHALVYTAARGLGARDEQWHTGARKPQGPRERGAGRREQSCCCLGAWACAGMALGGHEPRGEMWVAIPSRGTRPPAPSLIRLPRRQHW